MTDTSNVTELRPAKALTSTERSRRRRAKRKQSSRTPGGTSAVASVATAVASPVAAVASARNGVTVCTTVAALGLAAVSAGFSITGMTSIFVGATLPVIGMGIALELGKLSAVACIGRRYGSPALRLALVALVAVLMGLNAIGAYGFLAKAHIGHQVEGETAVAGRSAAIDARIHAQTDAVADLDRRIGQIDAAVDKSTAKGRAGAAMALVDQQRKNRTDLVTQKTEAARQLVDLQVERARVDGERKVVEADLGPVRYLATLLGADSETALRWFVLVVALLLDPAAVLLLLAASSTRR